MAAAVLTALGAFHPVIAAAQHVSVYTAHESSTIEAMVPPFEKMTGITVDVVKGGSGDLLNRVKAEAAAPRADVIWSVGPELLAGNPALLEAYRPADLDKVLDPKFPIDGNWLPYTGTVMVIAVNTAKVKPADMPKTWSDLADPKWKGLISSARADSSGSSFSQYTTILTAYGDKGLDIYKRIFANFVLSDSSGAVCRYVNDGEASVGLTLEDNALQYVKGGGHMAIVYPADGTLVNADGVALVKNAPHPAEGRKFIDWVLSKQGQQILVDVVGRRSIRTDVPANSVLPPLSQIKAVPTDLADVTAHRTALLAQWRKIADSQ
jgi:iron(III) transport system substrate-binding protein